MPGTGKIDLVAGDFQWDTGRYHPPSSGGGPPPGWFDAPHEERGAPPEVWRSEPPRALPEGRQTAAEEYMVPAAGPQAPPERVNLVSRTAAFMGYEFPLSTDSVESIKMILAMEVCLVLERERERILSTLQQPEMPEPAGTGGTNVPEVSVAAPTVEPQEEGGTLEMQRMRDESSAP